MGKKARSLNDAEMFSKCSLLPRNPCPPLRRTWAIRLCNRNSLLLRSYYWFVLTKVTWESQPLNVKSCDESAERRVALSMKRRMRQTRPTRYRGPAVYNKVGTDRESNTLTAHLLSGPELCSRGDFSDFQANNRQCCCWWIKSGELDNQFDKL